MRAYYLFFGLFVITANFGYAFSRIGKMKEDIFSIPLRQREPSFSGMKRKPNHAPEPMSVLRTAMAHR